MNSFLATLVDINADIKQVLNDSKFLAPIWESNDTKHISSYLKRQAEIAPTKNEVCLHLAFKI